MKKFAIGTLITSGIMFVLGLVLLIIGISAGGTKLIWDSVANGANSLVEGMLHGIDGLQDVYLINGHLALPSVSYNEAYPINGSGEISDYQIALSDEITGMEIHISGGDLDILTSDSDYFGLERDGVGNFQYYVENGILYILSTEDFGDVNLYIPEGQFFDKYNLSAMASDVDIEASINADAVAMFCDGVDIDIDRMEAESFDMIANGCEMDIADGYVTDCSLTYVAGDISYSGTITGDVQVMGSAGELEFSLTGDSDRFNYQITSALSEIDIPGHRMAGLSYQKTIDNSASQDMMIAVNVGSVTLDFMEK